MAGIFCIVSAIIGRQLTKQHWHTLYTHPGPDNTLVLAVECPQGWEETIDPSLPQSDVNTIIIHSTPSVGWLHWWQEHVLRRSYQEQSIALTLTDSPVIRTSSENESTIGIAFIGEYQQITIHNTGAHNAKAVRNTPIAEAANAMTKMENVLMILHPLSSSTTTTKRIRHPLGSELDVTTESFVSVGAAAPTVSASTTTIILPDDSLIDRAKAITIDSEEHVKPGSDAERIRQEIIRRVRIVSR